MLQMLKLGKENINMRYFKKVLRAFGFNYNRTKGSHEVFKNPNIKESIIIQPQWNKHSQVKSYQVEQFLKLVEDYNL